MRTRRQRPAEWLVAERGKIAGDVPERELPRIKEPGALEGWTRVVITPENAPRPGMGLRELGFDAKFTGRGYVVAGERGCVFLVPPANEVVQVGYKTKSGGCIWRRQIDPRDARGLSQRRSVQLRDAGINLSEYADAVEAITEDVNHALSRERPWFTPNLGVNPQHLRDRNLFRKYGVGEKGWDVIPPDSVFVRAQNRRREWVYYDPLWTTRREAFAEGLGIVAATSTAVGAGLWYVKGKIEERRNIQKKVRRVFPDLDRLRGLTPEQVIREYAARYGFDDRLYIQRCNELGLETLDQLIGLGIADMESDWQPRESPDGAQGVMQLMPGTAHDVWSRDCIQLVGRGEEGYQIWRRLVRDGSRRTWDNMVELRQGIAEANQDYHENLKLAEQLGEESRHQPTWDAWGGVAERLGQAQDAYAAASRRRDELDMNWHRVISDTYQPINITQGLWIGLGHFGELWGKYRSHGRVEGYREAALAAYNCGEGYVDAAVADCEEGTRGKITWGDIRGKLKYVRIGGHHPDMDEVTPYVKHNGMYHDLLLRKMSGR